MSRPVDRAGAVIGGGAVLFLSPASGATMRRKQAAKVRFAF